MKHLHARLFGLCLILCFVAVVDSGAKGRGFSQADIDHFCARSKKKTKRGLQFDGKMASMTVMRLRAGKYTYPGQGTLLLFKNGHYLLKLSQGHLRKLPVDLRGLLRHEVFFVFSTGLAVAKSR